MPLNEHAVRRALVTKQILPYFQPVHDVSSGACVGAEILARLSSSSAEENAGDFLPPLGTARGGAVLARILVEKTASWLAGQKLPPGFMLSVNIAADMAGDPWLPAAGLTLRTLSGGTAGLVLELGERFPPGVDTRGFQRRLAALRQEGVRLALDDFGAGYSGLSLLQQTGAEIIKIPREFVRTYHCSTESACITDSILQLARCLALQVIADGVESTGEHHRLKAQGVPLMQGGYYSPPLSGRDFSHYLTLSYH